MLLPQFGEVVVAKDGFPLDHPYVADTVSVAPGERYSVLVHLNRPGTWVWHCHILNHVERDTGMFGMVTAVVVSSAAREAPPAVRVVGRPPGRQLGVAAPWSGRGPPPRLLLWAPPQPLEHLG